MNPTTFLLAPLAGKFSKTHKATNLSSCTFRGSFENFRQAFNPSHLDIGVRPKSVAMKDLISVINEILQIKMKITCQISLIC